MAINYKRFRPTDYGLLGNKKISKTKLALSQRQNYRCAYCQDDLLTGDLRDITIDHLIPGSFGESPNNHRTNLVIACRSCNGKKADCTYTEYLKSAEEIVVIDLIRQAAIDTDSAIRQYALDLEYAAQHSALVRANLIAQVTGIPY